MSANVERDRQWMAWRSEGLSLARIAERAGVSPQRVHQRLTRLQAPVPTHCKLDAETVRQVRESSESTHVWARRLGMHQQSVWMARAGFTWKHVA